MFRLAALPMYDLVELNNAHDALWMFLADHLLAAGVEGVPRTLDRTIAYNQTWVDPKLLLGQSCGLPIVDQLDGRVAVLGGFSVSDEQANATYSSKLVVHQDSEVKSLFDFDWSRGVRAAINGWDSLSGYVSLGAACADALADGLLPVDAAFASLEVTGGHVHSAAALADRSFDLACVDGHTLALLQKHRPESVRHLRVIASGPTIACLPLITALPVDDGMLAILQKALIAAAESESLRSTRAALGITGFVSYGSEAYEPIRAMNTKAKIFFDRKPRW